MTDRGGGGSIITFYSYKGGTGRTMALANVAWILASTGKSVLAVDWDLEAPGLHRFFHPFLLDKELVATPGLIDMVWDFSLETMRETPGKVADDWYLPLADVTSYITTLERTGFAGSGRIDLLPAGKQGPAYATRVNAFDWHSFYENRGGGNFLTAVARNMRESYDYVLIDSRTGVSDTSGVCTVQMPDALVVCFTLSTQAIEGASSVAASVAEQRAAKPITIFPVAMRVEDGEQQKLDAGRLLARTKFGPLVAALAGIDPTRYWGEVEVPYRRFYAFEEILATFGDRPHVSSSVLSALERLTANITMGEVSELVPPTDSERREVMLKFERGTGATLSAYDKGLAAFAAGDIEGAKIIFGQAFDDAVAVHDQAARAAAAVQLAALANRQGDTVEGRNWLEKATPPETSSSNMPPAPAPTIDSTVELTGYVHRRWDALNATALRRIMFGGGGSVTSEAGQIIVFALNTLLTLHQSATRPSVTEMEMSDLLEVIPSRIREAYRIATICYALVGTVVAGVGGFIITSVRNSYSGTHFVIGFSCIALGMVGLLVGYWMVFAGLKARRGLRGILDGDGHLSERR